VLVVLPVQADPGALIQALLHMAISAKRDVGLGSKGDQAPQTKVENGRALRTREVQRVDPRVLTDHGCREDGSAPKGGHGERGVDGGARVSPGWLWVRPRDDRLGGRGFREKGIWITTIGFWAGGIQRGLEGRAGVLGTHFHFHFLTSLLI